MSRINPAQSQAIRAALVRYYGSASSPPDRPSPEKLLALAAITPEAKNYEGCLARARVMIETAQTFQWFAD